MANVTLISAPSEVDKQKVTEAVHDTLRSQNAPVTQEDLNRSMQQIADRIALGEFNKPDTLMHCNISVTATINQTSPSLVVNFTWSF